VEEEIFNHYKESRSNCTCFRVFFLKFSPAFARQTQQF